MRLLELFANARAGGRGRADDSAATVFEGVLRQSPHVVGAVHDGEMLLLDARRGRYHALNDVARRVWEMLAAGTTLPAIVEGIIQDFELPPDVSPARVEQDVVALLDTLQRAGLLLLERRGVDR